ncbi:MAG: hypothetical protein DI598_08705 [Pseudopedobacter saltans]|uniref:Uncharacterized protein n=1 Tax=Pseudopedobacter saltans TaxID=151895 RepID=A0A2W5EYL0_9SPHI|nr:MAG: hypothetical protein DI598_08705 [Pseudopedobacter saltans]
MLLRKNIPIGYLLKTIKWEILFISIYTIIIGTFFYLLKKDNHPLPEIPIAVPMVMGTVISLLLGFRSNQAYDRWWEARKIWGAIVNDSRTTVRQLLTFTTGVEDPELKEFIRQYTFRHAAWCQALGRALRGRDPMKYIHTLLTVEDYEYVGRYVNVPNAILELQGRAIGIAYNKGWINAYQQGNMDSTLTNFSTHMGQGERIKNTIFPTTYSIYIHLALNFFLMMLPFSLFGIFNLFEIPMVILIAAMFLLIEKMAIYLQDPFENKPTDTPVSTIANNIQRDIQQMINDDASFIAPHPPMELEEFPYYKGKPYYQL